MPRSSVNRNPLGSIDHVLETVCRRGCRYVADMMARAERGEVPADLAPLCEAERRSVLSELKSIMSVYGGVCSIGAQKA
jgi:hypothetical protein